MIKQNKDLIKERFSKSLSTYNENATVQRVMANKLVGLVKAHSENFDSIFEVGSGSGLLTEQIKSNLLFKKFWANDITDASECYVKKIINDATFIAADIENIEMNSSFDLIISNATFQWVEDLKKLSNKIAGLLNENGMLAFSTFGQENCKEVKEISGAGLSYKTVDELKSIFANDFKIKYIEEDFYEINFNNAFDVLAHLKKTGTNSIQAPKWTKSDLQEFCNKYEELYKKEELLCLTYNPLYIILEKI